MTTPDTKDPRTSTPASGRARSHRQSVYRWFLLANLLIVAVVFAEPTFRRLTQGFWQRGSFVFEHTISLDAHAFFGYVFVLSVVGQVVSGFVQRGSSRSRTFHRRLGAVILGLGAPLFVAVGVWMIFDRGLGLPPERTIVFRKHAPVLVAELVQVMAMVVILMAAGWVAVRRGDIEAHVDAMFGMLVVANMIAVIRFGYALVWLFTTCPLSVSGMYFATVLATTAELALAYRFAGRLRQGRWVLALVLGSSVALGLMAWPWHSIWDVPVP